MSTAVIGDAVLISATESPSVTANLSSNLSFPVIEVEFPVCECCGLTEECTPEYTNKIRERYEGKWICGLCGEAVKDEIMRSERLISTEEAMARHMEFRRDSRLLSGPRSDSVVDLIAAVRQILRRSLDSSRSLRSMPCSPTKNADTVRIARSESCIPTICLTVESLQFEEIEEQPTD